MKPGWRPIAPLPAAALLALASPVTATALTAGHHPAAPRSYGVAALRQDLAAVRQAGGGDVNVLARVDRADGPPLMARIGTRAAGSSRPVRWNAHFRVASTTKTFTATVVLQLAAEKRLSMDDTVDHWLPGVVDGNGNDGSRITVRDLLRQTSGLYDYVDDPEIRDRLINHFDENRYDTTPPEGDGAGVNTRPAVSADGRRAVTVSLTTTTAPPDLAVPNRATGTLIDDALCDRPSAGSRTR